MDAQVHQPLLSRTATLDSFRHAAEIERAVRRQFAALDKGTVLRLVLLVLPVATTLTGIVGSLYTVYASTDCQGSDFGRYSRAFLYTSIAYTVTNIVLDKGIGFLTLSLMKRPALAFATYCAQAAVVAAFFVTMVVLLGLVVRTACGTVNSKIRQRLKL